MIQTSKLICYQILQLRNPNCEMCLCENITKDFQKYAMKKFNFVMDDKAKFIPS